MFRSLTVLLISVMLNGFAISCDKSKPVLSLEVSGGNRTEVMDLSSRHIEKIGINERYGDVKVEITLSKDIHAALEDFTKNKTGNTMIIKSGTEVLFTGIIREVLRTGTIAFSVSSDKSAIALIAKMGRTPDFHFKLAPEELEAAKRHLEPMKNPWAEKAVYANLERDFGNAENFARKAIESNPKEPAYHEILSTIFYSQGKRELALEEMLTAEILSSKEDLKRSPGIYLSIAELYGNVNEYAKAKEYINKVLFDDQNNLLAHLDLAQVYEKMEKYDLAMQEYVLLSQTDDEHFQKMGVDGIKRLRLKGIE